MLMDENIKRIILAYLEEDEVVEAKEAQTDRTPSNYVVPFTQMMDQYPYYTDQEVTDVHLQLNSPVNNDKPDHNLENLFVYPEQDWQNADWAGGNFTAPYDNHIQKEFNRSDNTPMNLYDPMKGASESFISDLSSRTASTIDSFLSTNKFIKVSSMDLEQFLKVSDETLIHKSDKDIWKMVKDKEGNVYISRMHDEDEIK